MKAWIGDHRTVAFLVVMNALNAFDAACTVAAVTSGRGEELNPLMDALLHQGVWTFYVVKVLMVAVAAGAIATFGVAYQPRTARVAAVLGASVYVLIGAYHIAYGLVG